MESTWEFDTTVGAGSEVVTVVYEYSSDEDGTYNENISDVIYEKVSLMGIFTDKQFKELEMEGAMKLSSYLLAKAEEAKIAAYE